MIKISRVDAAQGMDETDFKVYEYETHLMQNWSIDNEQPIDLQFYLSDDGKDIFLLYTDQSGEVKHKVRFENKGKLTENAKKQIYAKYIDADVAYNEMKELLELKLGRNLTELEERKIKWFADGEYETIGVFIDLFKELSEK